MAAQASPLDQARALYRGARAFKREEQQKRRSARNMMGELRRFCAYHGIAFEEVIATTTETEEEKEGHGRIEGATEP